MKVSECMTWDVLIADPDQTVGDAAKAMLDVDIGVLPVGENDRLVGVITDRDIAVRGVAEGLGPGARIREVMSPEVKYCFEDQEIEEILDNMSEIKIRRLPVLDRDKRLVGIVSLADLVAKANGHAAKSGMTLSAITEPGGAHSQTP
jgi:CBS domain-containing protein